MYVYMYAGLHYRFVSKSHTKFGMNYHRCVPEGNNGMNFTVVPDKLTGSKQMWILYGMFSCSFLFRTWPYKVMQYTKRNQPTCRYRFVCFKN